MLNFFNTSKKVKLYDQEFYNTTWTVKLYETRSWFSLRVFWNYISSWISKNKITEEVKNSLDEIEQAFLKWETKNKWMKKAYKKFHEILNRWKEKIDEVIDFDDEDNDFEVNAVIKFVEDNDENFDDDVDDFFDKNPADESNLETRKKYERLDERESDEYFDKLIDKWIKLKNEWKNINEVFEELNKYYNKRRFSLRDYNHYIWIVWFREIRFFTINYANEIEINYRLFFEENEETKKKGDYSYLNELLEWDYFIKWMRIFDEKEEEEFIKKLINKWIEMKEKWVDFKEIKKYINGYYESQKLSLVSHYIEMEWDKIIFYKVGNNKEPIAIIEFEEHQETKKEKNYPYLDALLEWNHWEKRVKMVEKEDAEVFIKKLINKWIEMKEEWEEIEKIRRIINYFYETQKDSLNSYNLYIDNKQEGIEFYRIGKDWHRETLTFLEIKIFNDEEIKEYIFKMRDKWLKLKEEWKDIKEVYNELKKDYNRQRSSFLKYNIYIRINENSIEIYKIHITFEGSEYETIISITF